jgi:uncharacterized protein YhaN
MKLLDLHLRAYGPFTDRHLDLSSGSAGLHLVFGYNEAGKSSALRALKALLYGISERTQDAFVHANTDLRIGGRLRDGDGSEILCYRRKGRRNTLLDGDDRPIDEDVLRRLLHGVNEHLFEHLFGIDHQTLITGGEALLAERGREAEALFGSGLGSTQIRGVLDALEGEARDLFIPRASKPLINAAFSRLAEIRHELREVSLSARQWDEARKAADRAAQLLAQTDDQLAQTEQRRTVLERIRRSLPGLARRTQLRERLAVLGNATLLPSDFGKPREDAESKRRLAKEQQITAAARLTNLREKIEAQEVSEDLLAQADAVDDLREQLGSYRKAADDRPILVANAAAQLEQARQRLVAIRPDLGVDEVDRLRPLLGRRRRATELGGRREAQEQAVRAARTAYAETAQELTAKREELQAVPATPPLVDLQRAVEEARRAGDLDQAIREAAARLRRHDAVCARDLAALGLWTGDLPELLGAPLPAPESIRRFASKLQALDDEQRRLEEARAEAEAERRRTEEALRTVQLAGEVPSEQVLSQARAYRERGWELVKRSWLEGADLTAEVAVYAAGTALPEAFEGAVASADEIADRLRREAQRVHEHAAAQASREAREQDLDVLAQALAGVAERRGTLDDGWRQLWTPCALIPLPPPEMAEWLAGASRLREKAEQGDELGEQLRALQEQRAMARQSLAAALANLAEPDLPASRVDELAPVLAQAENRMRTLQEIADHRRSLGEVIADLETRLHRLELEASAAEGEREGWRADWTALMTELGLAPDASPAEVSDYLQGVAEILELVGTASGFRERVAGIDADVHHFERTADDILNRLAPDLLERRLDEAVIELHHRLAKQREAKSRLDELLGQALRAEQETNDAEVALSAADEALAELCRQAGCETSDQLPAAEERSRERRQLEADLRAVDAELIEGGDGRGIEELVAEAGAVDRDTVLQELTTLRARIETELQPERERLVAQKVNAERDFNAMAGGDQASALAEEAERTLSGLRAHAERYARAKLAGRVLRDAIEQFRRQHRDPILTRASDYFARLTCAGFSVVESAFDDADQSVLVGVRANGERVRVEGMSTGTRDQLYLALRLATLDHYLDSSAPLPFVVDDILIQFDDDRARATLDALAEFSRRTQVILFTHHGRVVEQAQSLPGAEGRVFVHELG